MDVIAQHRFARMAPRKLRQYRELLVGLPVTEAAAQLKFMHGQGPEILRKVLHSAIANARNNFDIEESNLKVSDVIIDGGFSMKRYKPAARGMAHPILKRTSHVTVVVAEAVPASKRAKKSRKTDIQDFTADDVAAGNVGGNEPAETVSTEDQASPAGVVPHRSKQEAASQKIKMMQQGGDPKKSHRRKSMGE